MFMCISTIDIQIDLFCQQLAATKRSKRAWSKRRPRRPWRFRTRTSKHSRFPRWKFVGSFPYPKIWDWLWKLCLKNMVFDVSFFFLKKNVWVGACVVMSIRVAFQDGQLIFPK